LQQSLPTFRTSALDGEGVEAAFSELGRLLLGGEA
jgi:hypothetical protein